MMRRLLRWLGRALVVLAILVAAMLVLGPYEPVEVDVTFDRSRLDGGVDTYLREQEARFDDIRPGNEKRVEWYGLEEVPTDIALVYFHGFSGSSEELRPVPDMVAEALGANLVFTRFRGHGRDSAAMAEARAGDWMRDAAEALATGRKVGNDVIVIATSTGGTIAAVAAHDDAMMRDVKGIVFVAPNFGINNPYAPLLTLPAARHWLPLLAGRTRSIELRNERQARHWTTSYPSTALMPMAAIVDYATGLDYTGVSIPALFYYSDDDRIVRPDQTAKVMEIWGGPATQLSPALTETDDRFAHVVAGDILSPGNTEAAAQAILRWIKGLE